MTDGQKTVVIGASTMALIFFICLTAGLSALAITGHGRQMHDCGPNCNHAAYEPWGNVQPTGKYYDPAIVPSLNGQPTGTIGDSPINWDALNEKKFGRFLFRDRTQYTQPTGGWCPTCPQQVISPQYSPRVILPQSPPTLAQPSRPAAPAATQPTAQPSTASKPASIPTPKPILISATDETKTGAWFCHKCRRPTVGEDWHTTWVQDHDPATFLCERCWQTATPAQRIELTEAWLSKQGIAPQRSQQIISAIARQP